jgi:hypothetical protein
MGPGPPVGAARPAQEMTRGARGAMSALAPSKGAPTEKTVNSLVIAASGGALCLPGEPAAAPRRGARPPRAAARLDPPGRDPAAAPRPGARPTPAARRLDPPGRAKGGRS